MPDPAIVLVEPDAGQRAAIEGAFRAEGVSVTVATSGDLAREALERMVPRAVVASLEATGTEALVAWMRKRAALESVPVLLVSSAAPDFVSEAVARTGARESLRRPFASSALVEAYRRCVRTQRGRPVDESPLKNEVRRKILEVLRDGERTAGDIARILDRRRPSLSHHFAELARHGLVHCRQDGPFRYYSLDSARVRDAWNDWLAGA
jgi:DNA-binding transcriptional ArsR family regulator